MILLFGSNNKHKAKEIINLLNEKLPGIFEIKILSDVLDFEHEVEENGSTLEENALLKAKEYYEITKIPCFADDTGLEIDYLNGEPGVWSARFAGEACIDADNRKKVLRFLKDAPIDKRHAHFRTVICFYNGSEHYFIEGKCQGKIIDIEKGSNGFGYDSIFMPDGYDITFAEMDLKNKNKISHRAKAINKFIEFLKTYQ